MAFEFSFFGSKSRRTVKEKTPRSLSNVKAERKQQSGVKPSRSQADDVTTSRDDYAVVGHRLLEAGKQIMDSQVSSISISPDSAIVAVAWSDGTIVMHDISNNDSWNIVQGHSESRSRSPLVVFSPNCKYIATSEAKRLACRLWTATNGQPRWKIASEEYTASIQFSPDSNHVAWAANDSIHICDVATGQEICNLPGHKGRIHGLHYTPAGDSLISISRDTSIIFWRTNNSADQQPLRIWQEDSSPKRCSTLSPDGAILATGDVGERKIVLWDVSSGEWLGRPYVAHSGDFANLSLAFSADGSQIASTTKDVSEGIHIRDVKSGKLIRKVNGFHRYVMYSPDGRYMVARDGKDGCPTILDLVRHTTPSPPNPLSELSAVSKKVSRDHGGPDEEINKIPEKD